MLKNLLEKRKSAILDDWFHVLLDSYPRDTASFLKEQKNRFANPVGNAISKGIEALYDGLLEGTDPDGLTAFLDDIIRIRAVQDFSPSQAIAFVFGLKGVVRRALESELRDAGLCRELLDFELGIDKAGLLAFDVFMKCREQVYEIKANEVKNRTYKLMERMNRIYERTGRSPEPEEGDAQESSV